MSRNLVIRGGGRTRCRTAGALTFAAGLALTISSFTAGPLAARAAYLPANIAVDGNSARLAGPATGCGDKATAPTDGEICTPTISTTITPRSTVPVGTPVVDTATVALPEIDEVVPTVTFNIYSGSGSGVCTGAPLKSIGPISLTDGMAGTGSIATGLTAPSLTPGGYEFQAVLSIDSVTSTCGDEPLTITAPDSQLVKTERDLGPNAAAGQNPDTPAYVSSITTALTGDVLQYQLTYSNTGNATASPIVLSDTIPTGTSYVPGSCILGGDNGFTCDDTVAGAISLTDLAGVIGGTEPFAVGTFKVVITAAAPFTISNQAQFTTGVASLPTTPVRATAPKVARAAKSGITFMGSSGTAKATGPKSSLVKGARDLGASTKVTPGSDPATPAYASSITALGGDVIQYRMAYSNSGSAAASGVTISDAIPTGSSYYHPGSVSSCLPAAGWTCDDHTVPGTVTFSNPSVPAGTTGLVAGTFKVLASGSGTFTIHNVAQVTTTAESTPLHSSADAGVSPAPVASPTVNNAPPSGTVTLPTTTGGVAGISAVSTPTTGAQVPFGLGLVLMLVGGALTALASRRRPSDGAAPRPWRRG